MFGVVLGIENNLFDRLTCFTGQNARTAVLVVRPQWPNLSPVGVARRSVLCPRSVPHSSRGPSQVIVGNWVVLVFTFLVVQSVFNKFSGIEARARPRVSLTLTASAVRSGRVCPSSAAVASHSQWSHAPGGGELEEAPPTHWECSPRLRSSGLGAPTDRPTAHGGSDLAAFR